MKENHASSDTAHERHRATEWRNILSIGIVKPGSLMKTYYNFVQSPVPSITSNLYYRVWNAQYCISQNCLWVWFNYDPLRARPLITKLQCWISGYFPRAFASLPPVVNQRPVSTPLGYGDNAHGELDLLLVSFDNDVRARLFPGIY